MEPDTVTALDLSTDTITEPAVPCACKEPGSTVDCDVPAVFDLLVQCEQGHEGTTHACDEHMRRIVKSDMLFRCGVQNETHQGFIVAFIRRMS